MFYMTLKGHHNFFLLKQASDFSSPLHYYQQTDEIPFWSNVNGNDPLLQRCDFEIIHFAKIYYNLFNVLIKCVPCIFSGTESLRHVYSVQSIDIGLNENLRYHFVCPLKSLSRKYQPIKILNLLPSRKWDFNKTWHIT